MASSSPRNLRKSFEMVGFRGLNVTAEAATAVSMAPQKPILQFQLDRGILIKTSTSYFFYQIGSFRHKTMSEKFGFCSFNDTVEADSAVSMRQRKRIHRSK
jgi:hypothetical protein